MPIFREMSGKIGKKPIYLRNIADKYKKMPKFPLTDYLREISCRYSPIHKISTDISDISITGMKFVLCKRREIR